MRIVFRRARGARTLLLAAAGATLIATVLITGLTGYGRDVVAAGARSAVLSAPPTERSLLVRGPLGTTATQAQQRDTALRDLLADGLAGRPVVTAAVGYAVGREIVGDHGSAVPDEQGTVFASAVFLDDLPEHADLVAGGWAEPGSTPGQATLAEAVAATLGVSPGDRVALGDRRTGGVADLLVAGVWHPRDLTDPYWLLTPGVGTGVAPFTHTYGPIVVPREDFSRRWAADASGAWIIMPELTGAGLPELLELDAAVLDLAGVLIERMGLADTGLVTTELDRLVDRIQRADLVGRSALVTPLLLIAVLGGYALLLIALLLNEDRRTETALIRARGAARGQIAGLAAREAVFVVLPAALLAPAVVAEVLRYAGRVPMLASASLRLDATPTAVSWLVSGTAALGCLLAMLGPAMRRAGTYVEELSSRSRPSRWAFAQRAGVDVLLVAVALLAWLQLRQYSSPLTGAHGELGVDPLLSAGPTVAVLAGGVLALRALPRITRLAERYVDRKQWTATMLGMWQAGRRTNAGPVLLLALSVAVSTLALCLASTVERSVRDQADFLVGADLRLVEASGFSPPQRAEQVASLPGTTGALAVWRDALSLGPESVTTAFVALDAGQAAHVVRYRDDLVPGSAAQLFDRMVSARTDYPVTALPPDARRLTGAIRVGAGAQDYGVLVESVAVLALANGRLARIPLGTQVTGAGPARFDVALPDSAGRSLGLVGFNVSTSPMHSSILDWRLADLSVTTAAGERAPVDLRSELAWLVLDGGTRSGRASTGLGELTGNYTAPGTRNPFFARGLGFSLTRTARPAPVPVVATTEALRALRLEVGQETPLNVLGGQVSARIVDEVAAVPGAPGRPSAMLADLPALSNALFEDGVIISGAHEFWLAVPAPGAEAAAAAAANLPRIRGMDRRTIAEAAGKEPYGVGARAGLLAAALGAMLLALVGIAVDVRATARRRIRELAVLHTLGAGPRLLARALMAEQVFLAGLGVMVGLAVGVGVAATMAPLVILTPAADRPVPEPLLQVAWAPTAAAAGLLLALALILSGLAAAGLRGRLTAAQLRIGED